jgi:hypothetical protein
MRSRITQPRTTSAKDQIPPPVRKALRQLLQAHDYAEKLGRDQWDFAVELPSLGAVGVYSSDMRWLLCQGLVEHAIEGTERNSRRRVFHPAARLALGEKSCFVLTGKGVALARRMPKPRGVALPAAANTACRQDLPTGPEAIPFWDSKEHTLYWQGKEVKHYKKEASCQEAILNAFQQGNWKRCVTVRFQGRFEGGSKTWLHDTVQNLNRELKGVIRFHREGNGSRVSWEAPA